MGTVNLQHLELIMPLKHVETTQYYSINIFVQCYIIWWCSEQISLEEFGPSHTNSNDEDRSSSSTNINPEPEIHKYYDVVPMAHQGVREPPLFFSFQPDKQQIKIVSPARDVLCSLSWVHAAYPSMQDFVLHFAQGECQDHRYIYI